MGAPPARGSGEVIAVVGATGRQGSAVVRHLLASGWSVRALTRDPSGESARRLHDLGAVLHRVDSNDPDTLRPAFDGARGVFNVQNPMVIGRAGEIRQGHNVAEAASATGIEHVVYGAAGVGNVPTGVDSWDAKLVVARRFRDLGLRTTVLRPMAFMELLTDRAFYPRLAVWSTMPRVMGPSRPVGWLCTDDLGAIAARVFAEPDRWGDSDLPLVADVRSIDECRGIWRDVRGRSPRGLPIPVRLFERFVGTDLTTMWRWLRSADLEMSTELTRRLLPDALTVRQFLVRQFPAPR